MPSSTRAFLDQPDQAGISRVFLLTFSWIQFWGVRVPALHTVSGNRHLTSGLSDSLVPERRCPLQIQALFSPSQRTNQPVNTQHQYLCSSTFNCKSAVAASMVWCLPHDVFCWCPELLWFYGSPQVQRAWNQTLLQISWQESRRKDGFHRRRGK